MRVLRSVGKLLGFGTLTGAVLLALTMAATGSAAAATTQSQRGHAASQASTRTTAASARPAGKRATVAARAQRPGAKQAAYLKNGSSKNGKVVAARGGGLQCVPFARNASGIALSGNAWQWWDNAAGIYARGPAPEDGAILSFRSNGSMRMGHVAVVSRVVNARQIEIDHANWAGPGGRKGSVTRGAMVVDVSENNDWTAVRVALGRSGDFGSIYPTNGFIYDRADQGVRTVVAAKAPAPALDLGPAPRDLRPAGERDGGYQSVAYANGFVEVAEAPAAPRATRARKPARARR